MVPSPSFREECIMTPPLPYRIEVQDAWSLLWRRLQCLCKLHCRRIEETHTELWVIWLSMVTWPCMTALWDSYNFDFVASVRTKHPIFLAPTYLSFQQQGLWFQMTVCGLLISTTAYLTLPSVNNTLYTRRVNCNRTTGVLHACAAI